MVPASISVTIGWLRPLPPARHQGVCEQDGAGLHRPRLHVANGTSGLTSTVSRSLTVSTIVAAAALSHADLVFTESVTAQPDGIPWAQKSKTVFVVISLGCLAFLCRWC